MDLRVAVVVLCAVSQVLGHPKGAEPSASSEDSKVVPLEAVKPPSSPEVKKTSSDDKEKRPPGTSLAARLKARIQEDAKLSTSKEAEDDAVRATRQTQPPGLQHMTFGKGPLSTTVCIQVRSDHSPQVLCGPQIAEEGRAPPPSAAAARFSPYEFARASPQGYVQGYPQAPPAAGRGYPMRRAEEDLLPRPLDPGSRPASGITPQISQIPHRGIAPLPQPVYVQRQLYTPVFAGGVSPLQALMRLNCAVEPSGQLLSPPLIRGSPTIYQDVPVSQEVFAHADGSPAVFGPNVVSPPPLRTPVQMRSAEDAAYYNDFLGSPQPYPYGAYQEELSLQDMMQGRSAGGAFPGYSAEFVSSPATEDAARREYLQLQALRQSKEKLQDIQDQLLALREREQLQNSRNSSSGQPSKDPSAPGISIEVKDLPIKAKKRQTRS